MKFTNAIDYGSGFKHLDLKVEKADEYNVGDMIASVSGNNFGDQIIHFRKYDNLSKTTSGFKTIEIVTNHEGEHWSLNDMKKFIKGIKK